MRLQIEDVVRNFLKTQPAEAQPGMSASLPLPSSSDRHADLDRMVELRSYTVEMGVTPASRESPASQRSRGARGD